MTQPRAIRVLAAIVTLAAIHTSSSSVIGANAVVTKDTEPMGVYVGVPASRLRDR